MTPQRPDWSSESVTVARQRVLDRLKRRDGLSPADLAADLGLTAEAIRQHLAALEADGYVASDTRPPSGRGRPASVWRLTERARALFPDRHAELTVGLLDAMTRAVGPEGVHRIVEVRARDQVRQYIGAMPPPSASLKSRIEALAKVRSEEGYMAEVRQVGQGEYHLIEHHCPICEAATTCRSLCDSELEVFQRCLGRGVRIERIEHLLSEDRRCVYRICKA